MAKTPNISRRDFVKVVVGLLGSVMGAIIGLPAIGYLISPALKTSSSEAWIPLGPLENYKMGVPTLFSFTRTRINGWEKTVNSYGVYVVRASNNQIKVFSNVCTHLSCRVAWKEGPKQFVCPCHDGHFDVQGNVVSGPPPKPLLQYETRIESGKLSIHFKEA
jgi:menaquinol-cytochrome c reductase iron-sulfur subunit